MSLCRSIALAALGSCVLLVSACDGPSPATVRPEPTPAAEHGKPPAAPEKSPPSAAPETAQLTEKTPDNERTPPKVFSKSDEVVTASVTTDPATVRPGGTSNIKVDANIESGWHIYAIDRPTGVSIPTSIKFELPKTLAWDGDWTASEPTLDDAHPDEPSFIYTGSASFSRRLRVAQGAAPGAVILRGNLHYQACDKFSCRAPTRQSLETQITIVR